MVVLPGLWRRVGRGSASNTHGSALRLCSRVLASRYGHLLLGIPPPYNTVAITAGFYCVSLTAYLSLQVPLPPPSGTESRPPTSPVSLAPRPRAQGVCRRGGWAGWEPTPTSRCDAPPPSFACPQLVHLSHKREMGIGVAGRWIAVLFLSAQGNAPK